MHDLVDIPTSSWVRGNSGRLAAVGGVLQIRAHASGQATVWVRTGSAMTPVIFPAGFRARLDPPEIVDERGRIVAREGITIEVSGGFAPVDSDTASLIRSDEAFFIQSEIRVL